MDVPATSRIEVFARVRPAATALDAGSILSPSGRRNFTAHAQSLRGPSKKESLVGSLSVDEAAPRSAAGLPTVVVFDKVSGNEARFELDGVFDSGCSQREVFAAMGTHHVSSVIDGFNSTIFAYGRTSSGKTHSITGPLAARGGSDGGWSLRELEREAADPVHSASQLGLVPRTLHALLRAVEAAREGRHFTACFACAEIYNRSLFDLCTEDGGRAEVRDGRMSAAAAERLTWHHIDLRAGHEDEAMLAVQGLVQRANAARATASTAANQDSSRSHVLYMCRVASAGLDGTSRNALLSIVDLAGSESLDAAVSSGAGGEQTPPALGGMGSPKGAAATMGGRDAETRAINSSLHTLTRVVAAYAAAPPGQLPAHVPFRESLLTLMLRDSIGGNCRTSVIVTLSGDEDQLVHSLKSCAFARLARGVNNCARVNRSYDPAIALDALRAQVSELTAALAEAEAARDAATAAAAAAAEGSLNSLLADAAADPDAGRLDARLRGWVEAALPWDDEAGLPTAVVGLAAVADSLKRCVRATGVPTSLDSPPRADAATEAMPLRPASPPAAVSAGTQMSPPPPEPTPTPPSGLLAFAAATAASPPSSPVAVTPARESVPLRGSASQSSRSVGGGSAGSRATLSGVRLSPALARPLSPGEARAAVRAAAISLADACDAYADELEAGALPPARLVRDLVARVRGVPEATAQDERIRMLEAQAALTRARGAELRALDSGLADESAAADASAPCAPLAPPPLGPSGLRAWQVLPAGCGEGRGEGAWTPLPAPVVAALDAALREGGSVVVVNGGAAPFLAPAPRGFLCAGAATIPALSEAASVPPAICHPSLEAAWTQGVGLDGIAPFASSVLDPRTGLQVCSASGASRPLRRVTALILCGGLRKRGARSGAWIARPFALTPAGLHQLRTDRPSAAAAAAVAGAAPPAQAAHIAAIVARTKVDFYAAAQGATVAALAPAGGEEGADAALDAAAGARFIVTQNRAGVPARTVEFAASSLDEAARWVDAINAAAAGAYGPVTAPAPQPPASLAAAASDELRHVRSLVDAQLCLQRRPPAWRSAAGAGASDWPAPLGGGAPGAGAQQQQLGPERAVSAWCGRGPAGVPALLPPPAALWRSSGEPLVAEILASDGLARLARRLGFPTYAVVVLAAAVVRNAAAADAFEAHAAAAATTTGAGGVRPAFAVAQSRAALLRMVAYPGAICPAEGGAGLTSLGAAAHRGSGGGGGVGPAPLSSPSPMGGQGRLVPLSEAPPAVFADVTGAVDAHVSLMRHGIGGPSGGVDEAAGRLAIVVLRAAVPAGTAAAAGRLAPVAALPTQVVWVQVAPGLGSGRPSLPY